MDAEDITQEVMIRFWENMDQINMLNIKTWLYRTAYNRCIDLLRKRKLELNREIPLDESMEESFPAPESNIPNKAIETKEQNEILIIAINNLPEDQKNVLIMYELQGLKYREISNVMGLPINTVKVYIMRARKNLHNSIINNEVFANGRM